MKNRRKKLLKRVLSMLCVFVLLLTMNSLKQTADTLSRKPMCGIKQHTHSKKCYKDGELVCGREEHVHTDACFQQRPVDDIVIDDDPEIETLDVVDGIGDLDLSLDLDGSLDLGTELVSNDVPQYEASIDQAIIPEETPVFALGEKARLSRIIDETGIRVDLNSVIEVGVVDNGDSQLNLIDIRQKNGDYIIRARQDFAEVELALVLENEVKTIRLVEGRAPEAAEAPAVEAHVPAPETEAEGDGQPGAVAIDRGMAVEAAQVDPISVAEIEQPDVQPAEMPEEGQYEPSVVEDGQYELDADAQGPLSTGDDAPVAVEEVPQGVQDQIEDAQTLTAEEVETPVEVPSDEQPADEEAVEAPSDEQPGDEEAVEVPSDEQPAEGEVVEAPSDEQPNTDKETEESADEQPADEEAVEAPSDEQPGDEEAVEESADEQPADEEAVEVPADEQPAEGEAVEAPSDEQPADEEAVELPSDEQPADEEAVEVPSDEQPADEEAVKESADEQPADEEAVEEPSDEQPGDEEAVEAPSDEQPADEEAVEEAIEEPSDEQPNAGEETEEPSGEESSDGEIVAGDQGDGRQTAAVIDLSGVEAYPLSLRGLLAEANVVMPAAEAGEAPSEAEEAPEAPSEAGEAPEAPEDVSAWIIEYDDAVLAITLGDDDYSVMPLVSFDEATVAVNGFELTLTHCALAEAEPPEERAEAALETHSRYAATIDLSAVEDYPLSLNEMMGRAVADALPGDVPAEETSDVPAEETPEAPAEETSDVPADEQPEDSQGDSAAADAADVRTIEYDESLLAVEAVGDDCLVTPVAAFDATAIHVAGGDADYVLTLINYAPAAAVSYPAQRFEESTDTVTVIVDAPAGAFPEGTRMLVRDVEDAQTISDIEDTVTEDFVEVTRVHAVDISFRDADGAEIEPLVPIAVVMNVPEVEAQEAPVVVHVDDAGEAQRISMSESEQPVPADEAEEGEAAQAVEAAEGSAAVAFTADSFSVYAVVMAKTIETKYIDAAGDTWNISLAYTREANIPVNATLRVEEVTSEEYLERAAEALESGKRVTQAYFFDIAIVGEDGEEIQPEVPVQVSIALAEDAEAVSEAENALIEDVGDPVVCAMHITDADTAVLEASETDASVTFDAESFSVWGVVYTVDFHYTVNGATFDYGIPGGDCAGLRALLPALGIVADDPETEADELADFMAAIADVTFSNPGLVAIYKTEENATVGALRAANGVESEYSAALTGEEREAIDARELTAPDWAMFSLKPFNTDETLTVAMDNGDSFAVAVTDAQIATRVLASDGNTYNITLTFGPEAEIPLDAELRAEEIVSGSTEWLDYVLQALDVVDNATINPGNRFFDIEILSGEEKIEPKAPVSVDIALENGQDGEQEPQERKVVHFEENGPVVLPSETRIAEDESTTDIRFEAASFSVYGVIVDEPTSQQLVTDLDGKTAKISVAGRYMTCHRLWRKQGNNNDNFDLMGKGSFEQAADWHFESAGETGKYYIWTWDKDNNASVKAYLHMDRYDGNDGHAHLNIYADGNGNNQRPKQAFTVTKQGDVNYTICCTDIGTYYVNEHNYNNGPGFVGWRDGNDRGSKLILDFQGQDSMRGDQYILVTKYEGQYYVILNDGTLVKTDAPVGQQMVIDDPMMWTFTGNNLYHRYKETGFTWQQLAYDRFYRYLDPDEATALIDEDYDNTTGHLTGATTEYKIDTRPLMDTTKLTYANHRISSLDNPSNYIGVVRTDEGLKIVGKQNSENAAEIYFVAVPSTSQLIDEAGLVNERYHTVNHIDISIVGRAVFSVPLAYGTYYYKVDGESAPRKLIVNRDNPVTVDIAQEVPVDRDDVKRATITAYTIETDPATGAEIHVPKDNVFFVSGYSGNEDNGASTNQTRIEGSFKVADMAPLSADQTNTADWEWVNESTAENSSGPHYRASQEIRQERLNHKVYYTVETTKKVSFDFMYNGHKLYSSPEAAQAGSADGVSKGSASVKLSATFNYWDGTNECPPLGWDRAYWREGGIIYSDKEQTGSGMDFALGTIDKDKYGVLAIEITKFIIDDAGNAITPLNDVENVFHVYRSGSALTNEVTGKDVDRYKGELANYDYTSNGYVNIHDKSTTVGEGGVGTVYDYDVDPGMIYIEEDTSEQNLPRSIEDVNGKTWTYKKTFFETEYVWRDDGIEYRRHVSREYDDPAEAYNSVPEVLGAYRDINDVSQYNGFLEFFVYNVYEAKPIDVKVRKSWKQQNGFDADIPENARITVTLGRYHLVEDEEHPISGDLVINHTVSGLQDGDKYYATYNVKLGDNKVLRSGTLAFGSNGTASLEMTGLNPDTYTLELTESANGYTMDGGKASIPITIETGKQTTVTANTVLQKSQTQKLVSIHVTNRLDSYSAAAYQDNTYSFPVGETIVFTIHRPARAYTNSGFWAKLNGDDFPWPTEGDDTTWTYVDQHWEYTVPDANTTQTLNFEHNWNQEQFYIIGVERKKNPEQGGTNVVNSNTTLASGGSVSIANGAATGAIGPRVSAINDKYIPETVVPGMMFVDDDGVWLDAEGQEIDKTVVLANGMWEEVVSGLPAVDQNGYKYLYYIKGVVETGIDLDTEVEIMSSGDYVLTSDGEDVLEVTNWVPNEPPVITLRKVDDNGNPLSGATFQIDRENPTETVSLTPVNTTTFRTDALQSGTYTVTETPPDGYKGMTSSFQFTVNADNEVVVSKDSLPAGVSYDKSCFTFTVENVPQGKLKLIKRWLDINGNDTTPAGPVSVKLIQMVRNKLPTRVLRVKIHWNKDDSKSPDYNSVVLDQVYTGRGTATFTWHWNEHNQRDADIITVKGGPVGTRVDKIEPTSDGKKQFKLIIPDGGNGTDSVTVYIDNSGYYPFEYGNDNSIRLNWSGEDNPEGEGYTATGATRVVELNAGNNWSREFTYSGMGPMSPTSSDTTLPAQYTDGRQCRYFIVEENVPASYTVTYSDTNAEGLGIGVDGTITAYNRKTTTDVSLVKIDRDDRVTPLPGATFAIYQLDTNQRGGVRLGGALQTETTAMSGSAARATFTGLGIGYYEIEETVPPENYTAGDDASFYIKVTTNGVFAITKDENKYPARWSVRSDDSRVAVNQSLITVGNTPVGSLAITKAFEHGSVGAGQDFTFTVALLNTNGVAFNGNVTVADKDHSTPTAVPVTNGSLQVSVTGDGTATISNIPAGTTYTVTENEQEGWMQVGEVVYSNPDRVITKGITDTATVTNAQPGALKITKAVTVNDRDNTSDLTDGTYTFEIAGVANTSTASVSHTVKITFANGRATSYSIDGVVTELGEGQVDNRWSVLVPDLIPGEYTIVEADPAPLKLKTVSGGNPGSGSVDGRSVMVTVVPGKNTESELENSAVVEFINNREVVDVDAGKIWMDGETDVTATILDASVTLTLKSKVDDAALWQTVTGLTQETNGFGDAQVTLPLADRSGSDAWKVSWTNLPRYADDGTTRIQYCVVENDAKLGNQTIPLPQAASVKAETFVTPGTSGRLNPYAVVSLTNTLPKTSISVTKQWLDGVAATPPADRVFSAEKTIRFTLYQKKGDAEGAVYTAQGIDGVWTLTYHPAVAAVEATGGQPAVEAQDARWDTETITDLPMYAYVTGQSGAAGQWVEASYYVKEEPDTPQGVTIAYRKGDGETETPALVGNADTERTITIINTDCLVNLEIVKVDSNGMTTPLAGAEFTLTQVKESDATPVDPQPACAITGATESDGRLSFTGIPAGYYKVLETRVPDGYILTDNRGFYLKVDGGTIRLIDWNNGRWENERGTVDDQKFKFSTTTEGGTLTGQVTVGNDAGVALPATGGSGTTLIYMLGGALLLLAVLGLTVNGRRRYRGGETE